MDRLGCWYDDRMEGHAGMMVDGSMDPFRPDDSLRGS